MPDRAGATLALWLAVAPVLAFAADASGRYAVDGPGRARCDAMPTGDEEVRLLAGWVAGWISASNRALDDTYDLTPWQPVDVLIAQLRQYCAANPERSVAEAMDELTHYLAPDRLSVAETPVGVDAGARVVVIYPSVLERVRARLADAGHTAGDGTGPLIGALRAFQAQAGLPVTGLPDTATILTLERGAP